jgi:hypothetical protein
MERTTFYPMTERPKEDESDNTFSKTVLIYDDLLRFIGLGYFDFEQGDWSMFTNNKSMLKCWCYVPQPQGLNNLKNWASITFGGYNKFL